MMACIRFSRRSGISLRVSAAVICFVLFAATGCSGSLMMDVTPPPGFQPTRQVLATDPAVIDISPLLPPDPAAGKIVYSENCAPCHGLTGMGDGERIGSLPVPPPPLGSLSYSRKISPTIWFQTVTQGKIEKLMPGFGSSLSDRQRWDVVAYLLSLGTKEDQLVDGEQVFSHYCQGCHGLNAAGRAGQTTALTATDQLQKSLDDLVQIITMGKGTMPAMGDDLTEDQKLYSSVYIRSLVFAKPISEQGTTDVLSTEIPTQVVDQTHQNDQDQTLGGNVVNGSGQAIPSDLLIELTGYDAMQPVYTQKQNVDKGGRFTFQQVPEETGRIYLLKVNYKGNIFISTPIHSGQPEVRQNQQVTIYEPSTDASPVKADRMHIFFEFPSSDIIRVVQMYVLSNPTNSLITSPMSGTPIINYPLPAGAGNLQFQGGSLGERFVLTPDGFGDTQAIFPGSGTQVLFSYDLPYKTDLLIFIKIPLPVDVTNIMLPSSGVAIKSKQLQDLGEKTIQNSTWHIYTSSNLAAASRLDLLVSGKPKVADPQEDELNTNLAVGVLALAVSLIIVSTLVYQKIAYKKSLKQTTGEPVLDQTAINAVLDAIIALDDQFHAGQIPAAAYRERRAELKNRLREERA
jgi:mono/diheme cytochrome c family protein